MKITEGLGRALFFVVGAPKSGTTWVQLMLNGHAAIDCACEGHFTDWLLEDVRGLLAKYTERQAFNNAFVYDDDGYFPASPARILTLSRASSFCSNCASAT